MLLPARVEGPSLRQLRGELLAHLRADPVLVLEAAGVQHLSDAGQAVLVTAHRAAVARGGRVHLHQPSPEMIAALRANGLRHLLYTREPAIGVADTLAAGSTHNAQGTCS